MKRKLLLIEFSGSHTEILYSLFEILSADFDVILAISDQAKNKVPNHPQISNVHYFPEKTIVKQTLALKKQLKPDFIFLNSSQGSKVRSLCLSLLFDKTPIVGIHHNPEKLYDSFTQKIIDLKVKNYFVLADFIITAIAGKVSKKLNLESFYTVSFPAYKKQNLDKNLKYAFIPGVLEQDRRDYLGLIKTVEKHKENLNPDVRFVLAGNSLSHDGPMIKTEVIKAGLEKFFIFFDGYVSQDVLMSYAEDSYVIMPLFHPGTRWFSQYLDTKISGAYNIAYAFNKKLLMHDQFKMHDEFLKHHLFYEVDQLPAVLNSLIASHSSLQEISQHDFQTQKSKVLNVIKPLLG